ncbi:MAG: hypothetical protein K2M68_02145 [Muribaculaceae bacterium]|nr:hypothetical protein [Muribaculaceae bacterium]
MNQPKGILHFVTRTLLVVLPPVILIVGLYLLVDPYEVVHGYKIESFDIDPYNTPRLYRNKGLISLKAIERRVVEGDTPDSYIFGSSISCYYEVDYWNRYIGSHTTPIHFDSPSEGAASMLRKLQYLHNRGIPVNHALIVLDPIAISHQLSGDHIINLDPPGIAGPESLPRWHYAYLRTFTSPDFLISYLPYLYSGHYNRYGPHSVFEVQPMHYDVYRNEESIPQWDSIIRTTPRQFYADGRLPDVRRFHCSDTARVDTQREHYYRAIARQLSDCDYHVVVSPTIDLDTLSNRDCRLLAEIFGHERFHDFSVGMAHIALTDTNWYDRRHYRAPSARLIIDSIYAAPRRQ